MEGYIATIQPRLEEDANRLTWVKKRITDIMDAGRKQTTYHKTSKVSTNSSKVDKIWQQIISCSQEQQEQLFQRMRSKFEATFGQEVRMDPVGHCQSSVFQSIFPSNEAEDRYVMYRRESWPALNRSSSLDTGYHFPYPSSNMGVQQNIEVPQQSPSFWWDSRQSSACQSLSSLIGAEDGRAVNMAQTLPPIGTFSRSSSLDSRSHYPQSNMRTHQRYESGSMSHLYSSNESLMRPSVRPSASRIQHAEYRSPSAMSSGQCSLATSIMSVNEGGEEHGFHGHPLSNTAMMGSDDYLPHAANYIQEHHQGSIGDNDQRSYDYAPLPVYQNWHGAVYDQLQQYQDGLGQTGSIQHSANSYDTNGHQLSDQDGMAQSAPTDSNDAMWHQLSGQDGMGQPGPIEHSANSYDPIWHQPSDQDGIAQSAPIEHSTNSNDAMWHQLSGQDRIGQPRLIDHSANSYDPMFHQLQLWQNHISEIDRGMNEQPDNQPWQNNDDAIVSFHPNQVGQENAPWNPAPSHPTQYNAYNTL